MRIINTSDRKFGGDALVNGQSVYVDIKTGEGFGEVLRIMSGTIYNLARTISYIQGSLEDAKQEICLFMLEALPSYDKTRGAALSTFLYTCAYNKSVDLIRNHKIILTNELDFYHSTTETKIELEERTRGWDDLCVDIMYRIFVDDEMVKDVALDVGMTPWGLTRFIRRKLQEARNI